MWSNRRKQACWRQGAKLANLDLKCWNILRPLTIAERVAFLKSVPSYNRDAAFASISRSRTAAYNSATDPANSTDRRVLQSLSEML